MKSEICGHEAKVRGAGCWPSVEGEHRCVAGLTDGHPPDLSPGEDCGLWLNKAVWSKLTMARRQGACGTCLDPPQAEKKLSSLSLSPTVF